jgi:localization factor PodJL
LMALGYYEGPTDGVSSQALRMALSAYQRNEGLQPTGAADPDTIQRLATYVR